jgi:hypothetical protein
VRRLSLVFLFVMAVSMAIATSADAKGRGHGQDPGHGRGPGGGVCQGIVTERLESLPLQELSEAERAAVIHIREEEKLARDVYTTLGESWDLPIFDNIAQAEQRHMDHVALLVTRYELEDPVMDDAAGAFTDPELGELYAKLVATGKESMEGALRVGATIEDLDLADVQKMIDDSDNEDIHLIANNLAKGSRNHLRAFTKVLANQGYGTYTAQYLEQSEVDAIIATEHERRVVYDENGESITVAGGGRGQGQGKGNGGECRPGGGRGNGQGNGLGRGCCARQS